MNLLVVSASVYTNMLHATGRHAALHNQTHSISNKQPGTFQKLAGIQGVVSNMASSLRLSSCIACADLTAIDPMYQYSLPWFTKLVLNSLDKAAKSESVPERLEAIHSHFTASMYRNVCR